MIISLLFCIPNPEKILSTTTGQPLIELIYQSTGSKVAAIVLACGLTVCFVNGTIGSVASGSRLLWAMGRDDGAPFSRWYAISERPYLHNPIADIGGDVRRLSHIHPRFNIPINALLACAAFNIVFGLLYLGPAIAFNAYISSCTIFLNCSYAGPILILLLRGRKVISEDKPEFYLGHWKGWVVNAVAVVYVGVTSVFFTFPAAVPVDANTMSECFAPLCRVCREVANAAIVRLRLRCSRDLHHLHHCALAVQAQDISGAGKFIPLRHVLHVPGRADLLSQIFDNLIPEMPNATNHMHTG